MRRGQVIALVLVAVLAAVGIGIGAYNAGVDAGAVQAVTETAEGAEVVRVIDGDRRHGPWGFFLFPLFIIGMIVLLKALFWRGHHHGHGPGGGGWGDRGAMFEEWHRRMHGDSSAPPAPPAPTA